MAVTAAEIDEEIDALAQRFGIDREGWLRTLDKERGISPVQYARDIIYPALALRKLCSGRVQVTPKDLQEAFEAQYGEKLRCRMILVDKQHKAMQIWEELHKNPGGFEKIAQEQVDGPRQPVPGRSAGRADHPACLSPEPHRRAFHQLVDGDPRDRTPATSPRTATSPARSRSSEAVWVILRREELIPAAKGVSLEGRAWSASKSTR